MVWLCWKIRVEHQDVETGQSASAYGIRLIGGHIQVSEMVNKSYPQNQPAKSSTRAIALTAVEAVFFVSLETLWSSDTETSLNLLFQKSHRSRLRPGGPVQSFPLVAQSGLVAARSRPVL